MYAAPKPSASLRQNKVWCAMKSKSEESRSEREDRMASLAFIPVRRVWSCMKGISAVKRRSLGDRRSGKAATDEGAEGGEVVVVVEVVVS